MVLTYRTNAAEDSYNQMDELQGDSARNIRKTIVYNTVSEEFAIRHEKYVLIEPKTGYTRRSPPKDWNRMFGYTDDKSRKGQLFDLDSDVEQKKNILGDKESKETADWLTTLLKRIRKTPSSPRFLPGCDSVVHQCNP